MVGQDRLREKIPRFRGRLSNVLFVIFLFVRLDPVVIELIQKLINAGAVFRLLGKGRKLLFGFGISSELDESFSLVESFSGFLVTQIGKAGDADQAAS